VTDLPQTLFQSARELATQLPIGRRRHPTRSPVLASLLEATVVLLLRRLGITLATLGPDPMMGRERLTFGLSLLETGVPFLVLLIGAYAVSQLLEEVEDAEHVRRGRGLIPGEIRFKPWAGMRETLSNPVNLVRSSLIGVFIGAVPGAGGSISNLVAYDQARRASKTPERFGSGIPEGVIASESGNSSTAGGGLIPMIALGIPGSAVDAVLMAALMVHGISIGPRLIMDNADIVYGMFIAMVVASLAMLGVCLISMRWFLRVTDVPKYMIVPVVLACCVVGAYALENNSDHIILLLLAGLLGYGLRKLGFPLAPLVLGAILGPIAETNLRRALMAESEWTVFLTRPISAGLLLLALTSILWSVRHWRRATPPVG